MAKLMLAPALLMAIQAPSASAAEDLSGLLNTSVNAIRSCKFVRRADGLHLIISKLKHSEGDEIQIDISDTGLITYNYIFGISSKNPNHFIFTNRNLEKMDEIDISLHTAKGLRADLGKQRVEPIFNMNGVYRVFIGYGFRSSDEAQIFGACSVALGAK